MFKSLFTGNMWGKCDNGTEGLGCGRPETFRNCADVQIVTSTSGLPPQFIHNRPPHYYSSALRAGDLRIAPQIYYPLVVKYVERACRHRRRFVNLVAVDFYFFPFIPQTYIHVYIYVYTRITYLMNSIKIFSYA